MSTLVGFALVFLLALFLNFVIELLRQAAGTASVGPPMVIEQKYFVPIDITVYGKPIDGLVLSVPQTTDVSQIITSNPVQIQHVRSASQAADRKHINLSGLELDRTTRLLVPIQDEAQSADVQVVNARAKKISIVATDNVASPVVRAVRQNLGTMIFYTVYFLMAGLFLFRGIRGLNTNVSTLEETIKDDRESFQKRSDSLSKEANEIRRDSHRVRILLMARLSDYSKELTFWRDTIRKVLYCAIDDRESAEVILRGVTNTLRTYGTLERDVDPVQEFETIKTLAQLFAAAEHTDTED